MDEKKLEEYIFKTITTNWHGTHMVFPSRENKQNIVIDAKEIQKIIIKAIKKANG